MSEKYMKIALAQAKRALGRVSPNPLVGAVIVKRGEIVGVGYHHQAGSPHAEINALNKAGQKARNADLYVTLEPCSHYGRTAPCVETIVNRRIKKVVIGMIDPNPLVAGKGIAKLKAAGIVTTSGVLEDECRKLNEVYVHYITKRIPFVILKVASSLDGKIATKTGDSRGITAHQSLRKVHALRDQVDAILVGSGTVKVDDPLLTTRLGGKRGKDPIRVIVDSALSISPRAKVFNPSSLSGVIVATTHRAPKRKKEEIEEAGGTIITVASKDGRVSLRSLMRTLGKREITSVLIEGGTNISTSAFNEGIVDKIIFFYAPKILGGSRAYGITAGKGVDMISRARKVHDLTVKKCGDDVLVEGYLNKSNPKRESSKNSLGKRYH
jgi:diaminohydroxyphosphoribosylaminopyrimidine deaminase/5-amino-6-(5-phosphoribosylamino)uracil reductase